VHGQNAGGGRKEQITEGAGKKRKAAGAVPCKTTASQKRKDEGRRKAGDATKAVHLARGQDDSHSHVSILPQCGLFCTPNKRIRAGCADSAKATHQCQVAKTRTFGLKAHMCRNCHKDATQCMTPV